MGKIYVADAIMGSGKTSAAIQYMLDHPENKYLYITPYLDEVERVHKMCKSINMLMPPLSEKDKKTRKRGKSAKAKSDDNAELNDEQSGQEAKLFQSKRDFVEGALAQGKNIVTTHVLFKNNTSILKESVEKHNYVIIIDEAIDTLEEAEFSASDIELFVDAGRIKEEDGMYIPCNMEKINSYNGGLQELNEKIKEGALICFKGECRFWAMSKTIFEVSKSTIILTYKFDVQILRHYFDISHLEYEKIGVTTIGDKYYFCDYENRMVPDYAKQLSKMVTVLENRRMNSIGDGYYALSKNWFKKNLTHEAGNQLRRNLDNFHKNINRGTPASKKLWASCKIAIKDFGVSRAKTNRGGQAVSFNYKASNEYRNCVVFSYLYNVFMNGTQKIFLQGRGCDISREAEEQYALSIMLQCMWRTAIRDGKPITVYVPSARMRQLLKDWIVEVEEEYRQYITRKVENNGEVELWEME